ncbi:MAG: beta-aspartyl-peptidase [Pseudomonadota bacterium]|nr:beta-aspartyl-peptidase [Pseudomonadota bacterium]
MLTLIKNVECYAPSPMGTVDILIANNAIACIDANIAINESLVDVIDGSGLIALPGLVDSLVHISGGGGEGGFHTRTPQMSLTEASLHGVTTVVGALGTDATTRTLPDLLAKAKGLNIEGISAYCYTGSYHLPARTITGSVTDDIALIDCMIGVGEVAIADHRAAEPTVQALAEVAAQARTGGMISGKAGIVYIHTGDGKRQLSVLHDVVNETDIPASQFYPTHINRNQSLLDAGITWTRAGGVIDMTTSTNEQFIEEGEIPAAQAIAYCLSQGVPASQLSMSSDGNASLPVFNENGALVGLEVGKVESLFAAFKALVLEHNVSLKNAISVVSTTPASKLKLHHKGKIKVGCDADLVLCDKASLDIVHVLAKGKQLVKDSTAVVKGTFE